jgi:hypothetical protein
MLWSVAHIKNDMILLYVQVSSSWELVFSDNQVGNFFNIFVGKRRTKKMPLPLMALSPFRLYMDAIL